MKEVSIGPNEAGQRLDKFLKKYLKEAGSSFIYKMLRKKNITLNGRKADGSEKLAENDRVCLFFSDETLEKFRGQQPESVEMTHAVPDLDILYEDENILLVDKPAGMLTQKARPEDYSLNEWLIDYLLRSGSLTTGQLATFRPAACNRLDRNTSGLVICSKSLIGSQEMSRLLRDRSLHKFYRLYAAGRIEQKGIRESWLIKDHAANQVRILDYRPSDPEAVPIKTGISPLWSGEGVTYAEIELFTGKTHQIRAQLAALGHPLIGDPKYGNPKINAVYAGMGIHSQLLHAFRLEFPEMNGPFAPLSHKVIRAPEPESFRRMETLRKERN